MCIKIEIEKDYPGTDFLEFTKYVKLGFLHFNNAYKQLVCKKSQEIIYK